MVELWTKDEAEYHGKYYDFPPVRSFPKPAQSPHPPVLLGGVAKNVFRRIVEWGDGWLPSRSTPEQLKRGRDTLDELASRAGRDPQSIQVVAYNAPAGPEALDAFEQAGADAMIVRMPTAAEGDALDDLEMIARKLLG